MQIRRTKLPSKPDAERSVGCITHRGLKVFLPLLLRLVAAVLQDPANHLIQGTGRSPVRRSMATPPSRAHYRRHHLLLHQATVGVANPVVVERRRRDLES